MTLAVDGLGVWLPHSGTAFTGLSLSVDTGKAVLLAGRNGAGASSALAAIAGRSRPGERRVGRIRYGTADLTFAHPDEVATVASHVSLDDTNDVPRARGPIVDDLADRLGLGPVFSLPRRDWTRSERIRARLARVLAERPRVLLLDQVLAPLESVWRQVVCSLVREYCAAGGSVLWAEQDLTNALTCVDRVVELDGDASSGDASWRWRSKHLPPTTLQQVAGLVGAESAGDHTVEGLRSVAPPLAAAVGQAAAPMRRRGSLVPVAIDEGREILVEDTEPPLFLCDTSRDAQSCRSALAKANSITEVSLPARASIRRSARRADRAARLAAGTTMAALVDALPGLRPQSWLTWHSSGEQAMMRNTLALHATSMRGPSTRGSVMRLLHEPFRALDRARAVALVERVVEDWAAGAPVLVVTTDVEAVTWFRRVVVWGDEGIRADGRGSAIVDRLPTKPLLAQVCDPHPMIDVDTLLDDVVDHRVGRLAGGAP